MKNSPEFKYYRRHSISYFIFGIIIEAISLLVIMAMGEEAKKDSTSIFISVAAILALLASIYYLVVAIIIYKTPKDKVNEVVLNNKVENKNGQFFGFIVSVDIGGKKSKVETLKLYGIQKNSFYKLEDYINSTCKVAYNKTLKKAVIVEFID